MDEKQLGHLNSFLIIVWKTQIERSNLHLDCFSRTKLINRASQAALLYWIPPSVTQTHTALVEVPIISHFYDIKWRHVYIFTGIKDWIWIQRMNWIVSLAHPAQSVKTRLTGHVSPTRFHFYPFSPWKFFFLAGTIFISRSHHSHSCQRSTNWEFSLLFLVKESDLHLSREML